MKKKLLKSILATTGILAFGFALISQCKAEVTTQVELTINKWELTISISGSAATDWLNLGAVNVSNSDQTLSGQFPANTFVVSDQKWAESGYYTTLQVTDLTWQAKSSHIIAASNVKVKAGWLTTITWVNNTTAWVTVSGLTSYASISSPVNYIKRDPGSGWNLWVYWDALWVEVTIPAHTVADKYRGTITWTLYDNDL